MKVSVVLSVLLLALLALGVSASASGAAREVREYTSEMEYVDHVDAANAEVSAPPAAAMVETHQSSEASAETEDESASAPVVESHSYTMEDEEPSLLETEAESEVEAEAEADIDTNSMRAMAQQMSEAALALLDDDNQVLLEVESVADVDLDAWDEPKVLTPAELAQEKKDAEAEKKDSLAAKQDTQAEKKDSAEASSLKKADGADAAALKAAEVADKLKAEKEEAEKAKAAAAEIKAAEAKAKAEDAKAKAEAEAKDKKEKEEAAKKAEEEKAKVAAAAAEPKPETKSDSVGMLVSHAEAHKPAAAEGASKPAASDDEVNHDGSDEDGSDEDGKPGHKGKGKKHRKFKKHGKKHGKKHAKKHGKKHAEGILDLDEPKAAKGKAAHAEERVVDAPAGQTVVLPKDLSSEHAAMLKANKKSSGVVKSAVAELPSILDSKDRTIRSLVYNVSYLTVSLAKLANKVDQQRQTIKALKNKLRIAHTRNRAYKQHAKATRNTVRNVRASLQAIKQRLNQQDANSKQLKEFLVKNKDTTKLPRHPKLSVKGAPVPRTRWHRLERRGGAPAGGVQALVPVQHQFVDHHSVSLHHPFTGHKVAEHHSLTVHPPRTVGHRLATLHPVEGSETRAQPAPGDFFTRRRFFDRRRPRFFPHESIPTVVIEREDDGQ